ncbi:MAG TPA: HAD hydrolase family protein [Longimicrobiaceae bacterium]|nr:HAD hydrolase family protein [Longimicrobiaceae bacterium]
MDSRSQAIAADRARKVKLVGLDVDGVLTDGGIYLGATEGGERIEMKRFEITDGLGIRLLKDAGIQVAIITGRESSAVALRAEELGVEECHQDATAAKLPIMEALLKRLGFGWEEAAFMGDDLADLPVLRRVGFPAAVANAVSEVRAEAAWISTRRGGDGAVRELAESLLAARGEWARRVEEYVKGREATA